MSDARDLRHTFDVAADVYEAARPSYPQVLFHDLVVLAELQPESRLLEIGCATGKATRPLLERGFSVVCVEIGAQLAAQARRNLAGFPVEVHLAPFETWQAEAESFDLVYAATAWHWLDPAIRYRRAHRLLRPGGHLAFWSARHAFPTDFDPFFAEIQEVYEEIGEQRDGDWPPVPPDEIPDLRDEIEGSGLFDQVKVRRYIWETTYSAEQYIALLDTFSGHIAMEESSRQHLYREIREMIDRRPGQTVRRHWHAHLHVAHARPNPPARRAQN